MPLLTCLPQLKLHLVQVFRFAGIVRDEGEQTEVELKKSGVLFKQLKNYIYQHQALMWPV